VHAIDDIARLEEEQQPVLASLATNGHLSALNKLGFVSLSSISAAKVYVNIGGDGKEKPQLVDVEFKNELSSSNHAQTLHRPSPQFSAAYSHQHHPPPQSNIGLWCLYNR
jgi:phosphopantothenate synthetase